MEFVKCRPSSRRDVTCSEHTGELGSGRRCLWGEDGYLPPGGTWGRGTLCSGPCRVWGSPLAILLEEKKECSLRPLPNHTGVPSPLQPRVSPPPAQPQTYLQFSLFCIQHQSSPVHSTSKTHPSQLLLTSPPPRQPSCLCLVSRCLFSPPGPASPPHSHQMGLFLKGFLSHLG